jgi:uncharacterized membrane protein
MVNLQQKTSIKQQNDEPPIENINKTTECVLLMFSIVGSPFCCFIVVFVYFYVHHSVVLLVFSIVGSPFCCFIGVFCLFLVHHSVVLLVFYIRKHQ